ncbi:MAG: glycosyltransferase family 9 protein [Deltaproteobacteria bacterium]|nr:glycosyltransferase family 9 protein [Deltaproteobacteria bacterium]
MTPRVVGKIPIDKTKINRILVRATNWIGDAVMTIPTIEAIRKNFPSSHLTVLARPWVITLLENHPAVDRVIPFERGGGVIRDLEEIFRVVRIIRRSKFDMAVLLQNAFEAALLAYCGILSHYSQGHGLGRQSRRSIYFYL